MTDSSTLDWILGELAKVYKMMHMHVDLISKRLAIIEERNKLHSEQQGQIKLLADLTVSLSKRVSDLEAVSELQKMDKGTMN